MFAFWVPFVIVGLAIDCVFIRQEYAGKMKAALALKGLASLVFVALGLTCYFRTAGSDYARLIVIGLILGSVRGTHFGAY